MSEKSDTPTVGKHNYAGVNITGDANVLGDGNIVSMNKSVEGITAADFVALLTQIRAELPKLPEADRADAQEVLDKAEKEAKQEKPRGNLIKSWLETVASYFKSAETIGTVATTLYPKITDAVSMVQTLFP